MTLSHKKEQKIENTHTSIKRHLKINTGPLVMKAIEGYHLKTLDYIYVSFDNQFVFDDRLPINTVLMQNVSIRTSKQKILNKDEVLLVVKESHPREPIGIISSQLAWQSRNSTGTFLEAYRYNKG